MASKTLRKNEIGSVISKDELSRHKIFYHSLKDLDNVARYAMAFIERWGMVAACPDGEDSAGRSKVRLATHEEVVTRAFDCAERAMHEAERRGHVLMIPTIEEIERTGNEE